MLETLDKIIEKNVKHYKSDWYKHDRPRVKEGDSFILAIRETGSDILFLSGESVTWGNVLWAGAWIDAHTNEKFWLIEGEKVRRIRTITVEKKWKEIRDSLPDEYVDYCEHAAPEDPDCSLADYRRFEQYCKKLQYRPDLRDWLYTEIIPY